MLLSEIIKYKIVEYLISDTWFVTSVSCHDGRVTRRSHLVDPTKILKAVYCLDNSFRKVRNLEVLWTWMPYVCIDLSMVGRREKCAC